MSEKTLHLTLKKKFFDMIESGEKKEEYREMKQYWMKRFFKPKHTISYEDYYPEELLQEMIKFPLCDLDKLLDLFGTRKVKFNTIEFKNGYSKHARTMRVEFKGIRIGEAKPEWSDNWQGKVFIISLGDILRK